MMYMLRSLLRAWHGVLGGVQGSRLPAKVSNFIEVDGDIEVQFYWIRYNSNNFDDVDLWLIESDSCKFCAVAICDCASTNSSADMVRMSDRVMLEYAQESRL